MTLALHLLPFRPKGICMSHRFGLVCLFVLSSLSFVEKAESQPNGKIPAETLTQAKARFNEAEVFYRIGEYAKALEGYKEAYLLAKKPAILFNMAQCYRYLKSYEEALRTYQIFLLDDPNTPIREEVEESIAELKAIIAQEQATPTSQPATSPTPQTVPVVLPQTAPTALRYHGPKKTTLYMFSGAAGVASGVFGLFALNVVKKSTILQNQIEDPSDPRVDDVLQKYRASRALGAMSDVLLVSAILSAGAGFYFSLKQKKFEAKLQVQPSAISLRMEF
jgi:tetratricopeptide (TPR) repeat protein